MKLGDRLLKYRTDYTVHYNNNNNVNVGTATVDIIGIGNYSAGIHLTFTIEPASIESAEVSGIEDRTYNGEEQKQDLVVKLDDTRLHNTVADATRIVATFVDQCGNPLPYYNGIVQVETSNNLRVVGPEIIAAVGGHIGFWIRTKPTGREETGAVTVRALNTKIPEKQFMIKLTPDPGARCL